MTLTIVLAPVRSKAADDGVLQRLEQITNECGEQWGFPSAIATCILDKEKEYGRELERLYQRLLKNPTIDVAVCASHKGWLKYQKQTCKSFELKELKSEGPSTDRQRAARFSSAQCLLRMTLQRIDEFPRPLGGSSTHIPMRVLETQGKGKNRRDCMRQFKAAWERFARRRGQPDRVYEREAEAALRRPRIAVRFCFPRLQTIVSHLPQQALVDRAHIADDRGN